jgi:malic enzyme
VSEITRAVEQAAGIDAWPKLSEVRIAIAGAGAAGTAVLKLLLLGGTPTWWSATRRGRCTRAGRTWTRACAGSRRTPAVIPSVFRPDVSSAVALAVADAATRNPG